MKNLSAQYEEDSFDSYDTYLVKHKLKENKLFDIHFSKKFYSN